MLETRLTVRSSRLRHAESLPDPWPCRPPAAVPAATADSGPDEAVGTEGWFQQVAWMIILRSEVSATHDPSLQLHKTDPGTEDSTVFFPVRKPMDSVSWQAGVCATSTNAIIFHVDRN